MRGVLCEINWGGGLLMGIKSEILLWKMNQESCHGI